jgi:hypothetical protein
MNHYEYSLIRERKGGRMKKQVLTPEDLVELLYCDGSLPDDRIRSIRVVKAPKGTQEETQNSSSVEIDVCTEGRVSTYQGTLKINLQQRQAVLTWWNGGKIVITFPF